VARVLVVEDDRRIGQLVASALREDGHQVVLVETGREAGTVAAGEPIDLVLLDLGLPDVNGLHLCRRLREQQPGSVVVMLTARREEMDVIVGLEMGADDYLTKPFTLAVLRARLRAHLRRGTARPAGLAVRQFGDLVVDPEARRCLLAGRPVALRAKEFDLLERLSREPGVVVRRETLMAEVWDENWTGPTKTLDVHVATLRRRLVEAGRGVDRPVTVPMITTLRGFGYRLDVERAASTG
jgi:DNA-binding response OmpR family regulator